MRDGNGKTVTNVEGVKLCQVEMEQARVEWAR